MKGPHLWVQPNQGGRLTPSSCRLFGSVISQACKNEATPRRAFVQQSPSGGTGRGPARCRGCDTEQSLDGPRPFIYGVRTHPAASAASLVGSTTFSPRCRRARARSEESWPRTTDENAAVQDRAESSELQGSARSLGVLSDTAAERFRCQCVATATLQADALVTIDSGLAAMAANIVSLAALTDLLAELSSEIAAPRSRRIAISVDSQHLSRFTTSQSIHNISVDSQHLSRFTTSQSIHNIESIPSCTRRSTKSSSIKQSRLQ